MKLSDNKDLKTRTLKECLLQQALNITFNYVAQELQDTKQEDKRLQMLQLITKNNITILGMNDEAEKLADIYVAEGVISPLFKTEAVHIAMTTVNGREYAHKKAMAFFAGSDYTPQFVNLTGQGRVRQPVTP